MVCEKPMEQSKGADSGSVLPNSAGQAIVEPEDGGHSDSTSSVQGAASSIKGVTGQELAAEQDVYNQPSYYNYYYPGYSGSFRQSNDNRDHSSMGVQADQSSIAYYMPGYSSYASGTFVGADGHCVSQPYYTSSGYVQTPVTYAGEAVPGYSRDLSSAGNPSNGSNSTHGSVKTIPSPAHTSRPNGIKPSKLYGPANRKISAISSNFNSSLSSAPHASHFKLNKAGSYHQPNGYANVHRTAGNFQPSPFQRQSVHGNNGATGYRSNIRTWNGNDKLRSNRMDSEMAAELTCGPRGNYRSPSDMHGQETPIWTIEKDKYNLAEFQTEYECAMFYVIKSYSEDDVHKCLKYNVWSSTANGNKKLDAAFHDAEVKAKELGKNCPVFLFFSVNGSGQFVGVAEMIDKLDFNKTMKFWQLAKWSGFFPVKWHIVKDIPNTQLRHIQLENNDNRPVTFTRDTQEIGMKQGLEMLKIFKNHSSKTSLLDDFEFYENREKALQMKRTSKPGIHPTDMFANKDLPKQHLDTETGNGEEFRESHLGSVSAIIKHTNNLSLNSDLK